MMYLSDKSRLENIIQKGRAKHEQFKKSLGYGAVSVHGSEYRARIRIC